MAVADLGRVVVVLLAAADFGRVVVVDDAFVVEPRAVVVVVDDLFVDRIVVVVVDLDVEPFAVVVVVDPFGFVEGPAPAGLVVVVVDALGTLGSSLAGASSRAWAGPPGAAAGDGDPGGGGMRFSRRAYCMIRAKTGAETCPP